MTWRDRLGFWICSQNPCGALEKYFHIIAAALQIAIENGDKKKQSGWGFEPVIFTVSVVFVRFARLHHGLIKVTNGQSSPS
jgi:hypothetical protein